MFADMRWLCIKKFYFPLVFLAFFTANIAIAEQPAFTEASLEIVEPAQYSQWIWVNTKQKKVFIMENGTPLKAFNNVAFGRGGVGVKQKRGDNITPQGVYTIGWNNDKSSFRHFFGLTYPSVQDAENGLNQQLINADEYQAIIKAHLENKVPPQNTALGGSVGIHGLGTPLRRHLKHHFSNWTEGCVALTNQQIDELAVYVKTGMVVVID